MIEHVLIVQGCLSLGHMGQLFLQGPIRAMGLQDKASRISLFSNYILGIPCCLIFGLWLNLDLIGLAIGIGVAQNTMAILYYRLIRQTDM